MAVLNYWFYICLICFLTSKSDAANKEDLNPLYLLSKEVFDQPEMCVYINEDEVLSSTELPIEIVEYTSKIHETTVPTFVTDLLLNESSVQITKDNSTIESSNNRPSFSGQSGGNFLPQLIPSGTPWPQKAEDYPTKSSTVSNSILEDRIEASSNNPNSGPQGNRPSFSGISGGNFSPQLVSSGTPWPSKQEDVTTSRPNFEDKIEVSMESQRPPPNRPSFAGQTGGNFSPQLVSSNSSLEISSVPNPVKFNTSFNSSSQFNRPPFAGQTGGNLPQQLVPIDSSTTNKLDEISSTTIENMIDPSIDASNNEPPPKDPLFGPIISLIIPSGVHWPWLPNNSSKPAVVDRVELNTENKPSFTTTSSPKQESDTTTSKPLAEDKIEITVDNSSRPPSNRPPFSGQSGGNFLPQLIPSGTPWPSKVDDYPSKATTTRKPILEDRVEISTTSPNDRPPQNRPFFAGASGGNFHPQLIPPGTPWPAKLEDYSTTIRVPSLGDRVDVNTENSNNKPVGNRPPFSGLSGGNFFPQLIPSGKPWPPKAEDNPTKITAKPNVDERIEITSETSVSGSSAVPSGTSTSKLEDDSRKASIKPNPLFNDRIKNQVNNQPLVIFDAPIWW